MSKWICRLCLLKRAKTYYSNFSMIPIACSIPENQEIQALWGGTGFLQWEGRHRMHRSVYEYR